MKKAICLILSVITLIGIVPMGIYAEERPFPDVPADAWYTETIVKAHELGLIQGDEKGNMMPTKPITRAEAVEIIRNHCKVIKDFSDVEEIPFTDVKKSDWFYDAVKWAYCYEIVKGVGNNKFKPNDLVTRQDFAVMLYKCYRIDRELTTGDFNSMCISIPYSFRDESDIAEYARYTMSFLSSTLEMTCNGGGFGALMSDPIIKGHNGFIMPKAKCSRSEAVQMLINIFEADTFDEIYNNAYCKFVDIPYLGS